MNSLGRKEEKEKKSSIFTRETLGVVIILFTTLCLVCLITREHVFYDFGRIINAFLLGCFGYFAFLLLASLEVLGVLLCMGKKLPFSKKFKVYLTVTLTLIALLGQVISLQVDDLSYGEYLGKSYSLASTGLGGATAGGLISALISYWINLILSDVGSYVVLSIGVIVFVYLAVKEKIKTNEEDKETTPEKFRSSYVAPKGEEIAGVEIAGEMEYPVIGAVPVDPAGNGTQRLFVTNAEDFTIKTKREMSKPDNSTLVLNKSNGGLYVGGYVEAQAPSYTSQTQSEMARKLEYIKTPPTINVAPVNSEPPKEQADYGTSVSNDIPLRREQRPIEPILVEEQKPTVQQIQPEIENTDIPMYFHDESKPIEQPVVVDESDSTARSHAQNFAEYADIEEIDGSEVVSEVSTQMFTPIEPSVYEEETSKPIVEEQSRTPLRAERVEPIVEQSSNEQEVVNQPTVEEQEEDEPAPTILNERRCRNLFGEQENAQTAVGGGISGEINPERNALERFNLRQPRRTEVVEEVVEEKPPKEKPPINRVYNAPPLDLLEPKTSRSTESEDHNGRLEIICQTLSNFNIDVQPAGYIQGPTVTRYEITMPTNVSVKKVVGYDDDLKMRLASKNGVRIQAPIPGKNLVGVEVSNLHPDMVGLRELLEGAAGKPSKPFSLMFAIGKDIVGNVIMDDLAEGPHYLVAGTTGSGKSVCLNIMIISMIMRYSPEDLRLILVDPKGVEFSPYAHIPHLMIDEIVSDSKRAVGVLQWACVEMERRFSLFKEVGQSVRDIASYNTTVASDTVPRLPRIVIVVDELSNLMETNKKEMEARILSLSQKARAAGIHLVLATQRPSVDIITGTIKNNLPSRIALKLTTPQDSMTIIAEGGAEKLLGHGDMLYKNAGMSDCNRYQGAFISDREKTNIIEYIIEHNKAYFEDDLKDFLDKNDSVANERQPSNGGDDVYEDGMREDPFFVSALAHVVSTNTASASSLQRRFRIGFNRAGSIIDDMARQNFISQNEGSKARRVLITRAEFEELFGPLDDFL